MDERRIRTQSERDGVCRGEIVAVYCKKFKSDATIRELSVMAKSQAFRYQCMNIWKAHDVLYVPMFSRTVFYIGMFFIKH